ncbi:hypothetical protein ACIOEX_24770, partial [Streptomyces sp. NPDC087850]
MNRLRSLLAGFGVTVALAMAPAANAAPQQPEDRTAAVASATASVATRHDPCTGEFRDDARLGPKWLPKRWQEPVGPLLKNYHRTGSLSPAAFLRKYWE